MRRYRLYQVDAFTTERFAGNPAGVVPDADGLTTVEMQMIARELNNSETAFIFAPQGSDHDVWIRFFTPFSLIRQKQLTSASGAVVWRDQNHTPTAGLVHVVAENERTHCDGHFSNNGPET